MKEIPIVKLKTVRESSVPYDHDNLNAPANAANLFRSLIDDSDREVFAVCATDSKLRPVMLHVIGVGGIDCCPYSVSNIFKTAILSNASSIFIAHNHPSGDVSPSDEDISTTKKVRAAGKVLGIELIDHLIIGNNSGVYYSFKDSGKMEECDD